MAERRIRNAIKTSVNVPAWVGWSVIAEQGTFIKNTVQSLLAINPKEPPPPEEFNEAMQRLNLSEQDLAERAKQRLIMTAIYLAGALGIFLYGIFHFSSSNHIGGVMALFVVFYCLIQAFSQHFWYFQIKQRRLGCTFREWLRWTFSFGGGA